MAVNYDSQEDALHMRVFRNRPEPGHKRVHVHPTHELNFLCHGYQGLEVENRYYTMCPGDLLVLPAGMEHSIRSDESLPYQRIRLHIPVNFIRTLVFGILCTFVDEVQFRESSLSVAACSSNSNL